MKKLSPAGLISVGIYLTFVLFFVARAEYCFHNDGLFCLIGYMIPALPWVLIFVMLENNFLPDSASGLWNLVFYVGVILSVLINVWLVYRYGRLVGQSVQRRKS